MLKNRLSFFTIFLLLVSFGFVSCLGLGLGDSIDTEGPELTVTGPVNFTYQELSILFEGTCSDNVKVTDISIYEKAKSSSQSDRLYGHAVINPDGTWYYNLNLSEDQEGNHTFVISATDAVNNTSAKSTKTLILVVDNTGPKGEKAWYVDRGNGIQTPIFADLDELKSKNMDDLENIDIPQNSSFKIQASFYDATSVNEVSVILKEGEEEIIRKSVTKENVTGSIFYPAFNFTHSELIAKKPSLATGKHYLGIYYSAKDDRGNTTGLLSEEPFENGTGEFYGYMLWEPESDTPKITIQTDTIITDTIAVNIGGAIALNIFDDDNVSETSYALISEERYNSLGNSSYSMEQKIAYLEQHPDTIKNFTGITDPEQKVVSTEAKRTYQPQIICGQNPATMYIVAVAKDSSSTAKTRAFIKQVIITDNSVPIVLIESPKSNSIPTFNDEGKFTITGKTYSKKGISELLFVYIPSTTNLEGKTMESFADELLDMGYGHIPSPYVSFPPTRGAQKADDDNPSLFVQTFSQEVSLDKRLTEIRNDASFYFRYKATDTAGKVTYGTYFLNTDVEKPLITETNYSTQLTSIAYDENEDLVMKLEAGKKSNIKTDATTWKISCGDKEWTPSDEELTVDPLDSNKATFTLTNAKLLRDWVGKNNQPIFTIEASDVLGNKGQFTKTFILSEKSKIKSIKADSSNGTYNGNSLVYYADFSKNVTIKNNPRLTLNLTDKNGTVTKAYADYASGSKGQTIKFTYAIPSGIEYAKVTIDRANPFNTEKGEICSGESDDSAILTDCSSFTDGSIFIDSRSPQISNYTLTTTDNKDFLKAGDVLTFTVVTDEIVSIQGDPVLKLISGTKNISFDFASFSKNESANTSTISFTHEVAAGEDGKVYRSLANCIEGLNIILDSAGNPLTLLNYASDINKDTGKTLDTTAPSRAPSINLETGKRYISEQTLTLSNIDTDCTAYYSLNNGNSYTEYDRSNQPKLLTGYYKILTKQIDKAGNEKVSDKSIDISIFALFPAINDFIVNANDGYYGKDEIIQFSMSFDGPITCTNDSAYITFKKAGDTNPSPVTRRAYVKAATGAHTVIFEYKVGSSDTDNFEGIEITGATFTDNFKDTDGHTATTVYSTSINSYILNSVSKIRSGIYLDTKKPQIVKTGSALSITPALDTISTLGNAAGTFAITLTFDEPVEKENGYIILQQKGDWAIPPVLTVDEFNKWYNKMSDANKSIVLMKNADGSETVNYKTGIAVGPYQMITNGLVVSGSTYVPDEDTKYVLDVNLGLVEGTTTLANNATGTVRTVAQIREAFESVGYHQHKVEVNSNNVTISGNTVTIKFNEVIEDGRWWELIIPDNAFRDSAQNFYDGMSSIKESDSKDKHSFYSSGVATPVIRVDRYSHGYGAREPDKDGNIADNITKNLAKKTIYNYNNTANTAARIAPTGYARARIDCETPGADIYYKVTQTGSQSYTVTSGTTTGGLEAYTLNVKNAYDSVRVPIPDITVANAAITSGGTKYTSFIIVGDGDYTTASKNYISAYAKKGSVSSTNYDVEGVFETVVVIHTGTPKTENSWNHINIEGGTAKGGQPNVSGFPLRDGEDGASPYSKNTYIIDIKNTLTEPKKQLWVSYEIISKDFAILVCRDDHSEDYPLNSYGEAVYVSNLKTYGTNNK